MTQTRIGTCPNGHTEQIVTEWSGRYSTCRTCAADTDLAANREAFLTEHPNGIYPVPCIKWANVKAKVTATECDGDCRAAKGDKCACSCGGRNHGIAWAS